MNVAIILLAGKGTRINSSVPKQFLLIDGKPLFMFSVEKFIANPKIDRLVLVTSKEYFDLVKGLVKSSDLNKQIDVVIGGKSREESVYNGLKFLYNINDKDIVLVHDSARPLISDNIIFECIAKCDSVGACGTYMISKDTIAISSKDGFIDSYLDRTNTLSAQTPQCAKYSIFMDSFSKAISVGFEKFTDDMSIIKNAGYPVSIVEGEPTNFKITTDVDLRTFVGLIKK